METENKLNFLDTGNANEKTINNLNLVFNEIEKSETCDYAYLNKLNIFFKILEDNNLKSDDNIKNTLATLTLYRKMPHNVFSGCLAETAEERISLFEKYLATPDEQTGGIKFKYNMKNSLQ